MPSTIPLYMTLTTMKPDRGGDGGGRSRYGSTVGVTPSALIMYLRHGCLNLQTMRDPNYRSQIVASKALPTALHARGVSSKYDNTPQRMISASTSKERHRHRDTHILSIHYCVSRSYDTMCKDIKKHQRTNRQACPQPHVRQPVSHHSGTVSSPCLKTSFPTAQRPLPSLSY